MLPEDWAKPDTGPEWHALPTEWPAILARYRGMEPSQSLQAVWKLAGMSATRGLIERDYIDADYRDEFSHFYAQTFQTLPDRCERVHFYDETEREYLGYAVLRPIPGRPVCRTVLRPHKDWRRFIACTATAHATPYGFRATTYGFPFISQDYQFGRCAHAAIWMIAYYFHLAYGMPRRYMSDIASAARAHPDVFRAVPSAGLSARQIAAVFHDLDMAAIHYAIDDLPAGHSVESIVCRYLNSRLPVLLLSGEHASVLIGYGRKQNGRRFFIRHDDDHGPYRVVDDLHADRPDKWKALFVPLPGRIYLAGEAAEVHARFFFESQLAPEPANVKSDLRRGSLRIRTYATTAAEYKRALRTRGLDESVSGFLANVSMSHWVWVSELQDAHAAAHGPECVIGEIVIDATSDDRSPHQLCGNLPGVAMRWPAPRADAFRTPVAQPGLYTSGSALHDKGGRWFGRRWAKALRRHR